MEATSQSQSDNEAIGAVVQASRGELFRLLAFLDQKLPSTCPIHSFVHHAITTHSPYYKVYYVKNPEGCYSAILGLKQEHINEPVQNSTDKCWVSIKWDDSDPLEMCKMSDFIPDIDWDRDALVSLGFGDSNRDPVLLRYLERNHAELIADEGSPINQYYLRVEEAIALEMELPFGVYVKSLERKHALTVHQNSQYRRDATLEDVIHEIDNLPSAGVFLKANDQLVSWIMCHPPFGMMRLSTLEHYRRRGYAKLAACYLSKIVAQSGCIPFVSIIKGNTPAIVLFANLGFRMLCRRDIYLVPAAAASTNVT